MRKVCAKFVPRLLNEVQKQMHVDDKREIVEVIASIPIVFESLVTCTAYTAKKPMETF